MQFKNVMNRHLGHSACSVEGVRARGGGGVNASEQPPIGYRTHSQTLGTLRWCPTHASTELASTRSDSAKGCTVSPYCTLNGAAALAVL